MPKKIQRTPTERMDFIHKKCKEVGRLSMPDLVKMLKVSRETIARDIKTLVESDKIVKKGKYITIDGNYVSKGKIRGKLETIELENIAKTCVDYIDDDDFIILEGGSLTIRLLDYLSCKKNVTILTNNLNLAKEISRYKNLNLIMIGGLLDKETRNFFIDEIPDNIKNITFNKIIFLCDGVDNGFVTTNLIDKIPTIKLLMKKATQTILLVDYSRIGKVALSNMCEVKEVNTIITNHLLVQEYQTKLRREGVELVLA